MGRWCFAIDEEGNDGELDTFEIANDGDASVYDNERYHSVRFFVNGA